MMTAICEQEHMRAGRSLGFTKSLDASVVALDLVVLHIGK